MRTILSLGLVKGLIGFIIGEFVGIVLTIVVRALTGLPVWNAETALVAGALFGVVGFMIAAGTVSD